MVNFVTAGFPTKGATLDIMKGFQEGGCDIIELGMPFTDPIGDGPSIQHSNQVALENGVTSLEQCLGYVKEARSNGIVVPILLMGYYNPVLAYGEGTCFLLRYCVCDASVCLHVDNIDNRSVCLL